MTMYQVVQLYTFWYTFWKSVQQEQILERFDPKYQVVESKPLLTKKIRVKTDQGPSNSDKQLDVVGQNSSTQNLEFSWKILSR